MDTIDKIEEYVLSLEEYFFSSLSAATTDLPNIHEAVNRLWVDISRYGPGMPSFPEVHLPTIGDFQIPPLPPAPPPPLHNSLLTKSVDWTKKHSWIISTAVLGTGLLVGYRAFNSRKTKSHRVRPQSNDRRQVVVVLGGDTPLALPLILDLEAKGYIVIASVSTPEAVSTLEDKCHGYVRALVLDPQEMGTIPVFLRSLASTLSRRFPITVSGDPFASPSSHPYIQSVLCLLTLPSAVAPVHAPLEHISLQDDYLPYLRATHIAPLQVIQALMPLLRTGPARARDKGKKTIVVCLPAIEARVGLPFTSIQSMSAVSTLRGVEVLRREINLAALTDKSESMKNIKVLVADLGVLNVGLPHPDESASVYKLMEDWSPSEKLAYGPAFASVSFSNPPTPSFRDILAGNKPTYYGTARRPTDVNVFVSNIVAAVSGGRYETSFFGLGPTVGRIRNWFRGERFSVGAGANTYKIASHLPSSILDTLLSIPHILISIRNRLLPVEPFVRPPVGVTPSTVIVKPTAPSSSTQTAGEPEQDPSENSSDVESNASDSVDNSWINLHKTQNSDAT